MVKISLGGPKPPRDEKEEERSAGLIATEEDVEAVAVNPRRAGGRTWGWCLVLGLGLMLAGLVVVGFYLYRHFIPNSRMFHCGVSYMDQPPPRAMSPAAVGFGPRHYGDDIDDDGDELMLGGGNAPLLRLEEDVEFDLDYSVSLINVPMPGFEESDPAEIVHDFQRLLTAYYDVNLGKCYVIALNTSIVMPPRNLFELMINIRRGTYLPQTYLIHEQLVVTERIDDVDELGFFIFRMCNGKPTFRLQRRPQPMAMEKRSLENCHKIRHFASTMVVETVICEQD
ncbi:integral membrane protein 2B-like [Lampetra planeri]